LVVALTRVETRGILILPWEGWEGRLVVMLRVGLRLVCVVALLLLTSACDVLGGAGSIDDIVLTTAVDADYCPVDDVTTFSPDDAFHCSVMVSDMREGSTVTIRWYYGQDFIEEAIWQVQKGGFGCVAFELTNLNAWPRGGYRVEIYLNGNLERMARFAVA
jgi:hypothetical protein